MDKQREKLIELIADTFNHCGTADCAKCNYYAQSYCQQQYMADLIIKNGMCCEHEIESRKAEIVCLKREYDKLQKECITLQEDIDCYKSSQKYFEDQERYLNGKVDAYEFCIKQLKGKAL